MKKPVLSGRSGDYPVGPSAADPQPMTASGFSASVPNAPAHEYTQEELDRMQEAEDSLNDDDFDEEDDRAEILGYVCMSCGHSQATRGLDQCNKCCGPLEEWYD